MNEKKNRGEKKKTGGKVEVQYIRLGIESISGKG